METVIGILGIAIGVILGRCIPCMRPIMCWKYNMLLIRSSRLWNIHCKVSNTEDLNSIKDWLLEQSDFIGEEYNNQNEISRN